MVQKMKYKHFSKDMILTKDDEQNFKKADKCYICNKKYSAKDVHVRDHCHITGKYRGSAHHDCNSNYFLCLRLQCHLTQLHVILAYQQRTNSLIIMFCLINGMIASSSPISSFALVLQAYH